MHLWEKKEINIVIEDAIMKWLMDYVEVIEDCWIKRKNDWVISFVYNW